MEGVLKEINGNLVLVDSKWYKVLKPEYLPMVGVAVSFSVTPEDPTTIKFIKAVTTPEPKAETKPTTTEVPIKKETLPTKPTTPAPRQTGYGSPEDVRGKEVGCAIGAAAQILAGSDEPVVVILKKMKELVEGILIISKEAKAK